jgi:hypothetical protein
VSRQDKLNANRTGRAGPRVNQHHNQSPTTHFAAAVTRAYVDRALPRMAEGPLDASTLASVLNLSEVQVLTALSLARRTAYSHRCIEKRRGFREILSPPPVLKETQRAIYQWLVRNGPAPGQVAHGFVPGRSHVSHAREHVGRSTVASIDLQDFFGSVTDVHIWVALQGKLPELTDAALRALITICTVEDCRKSSKYKRTWLTRAHDLLSQYIVARYPTTGFVLNACTTPVSGAIHLDEHGLRLACNELGVALPEKTFLKEHINKAWPASAARVALFVYLRTGVLYTRSRARLLGRALRLIDVKNLHEKTLIGRTEHALEALKSALASDLEMSVPGSSKSLTFTSEFAISELDDVPKPRAAPILAEVALVPISTRVLPQGAPSSPWLANLAVGVLDQALVKYAAENRLTYSRYADDLAFSGDELPARFCHDIAVLVEREGLRINRQKIAVHHRGRRQTVTGIIVNDKVSPTTISRRQLRVMLHAMECGREVFIEKGKPLSAKQLKGHLAYWHMVDGTRVPWPPARESK